MNYLFNIVSWGIGGLLMFTGIFTLFIGGIVDGLCVVMMGIGISPLLKYQNKIKKVPIARLAFGILGFLLIGISTNPEEDFQKQATIPKSNIELSKKEASNSNNVKPNELPNTVPNKTIDNEVLVANEGLVVSVIDGDTIEIMRSGITEKVRIIGIDAPEFNNTECFSKEASQRLEELVLNKNVALEQGTGDDMDIYNRLLRYIRLDNLDIGAKLIIEGYAKSYTKYPHARLNKYESIQNNAKKLNNGLWLKCSTPPVEEKDSAIIPPSLPITKTQINKEETAPMNDCYIKGNINSKKKKLYHTPSCPSYNQTLINRPGERCFNTEQEAIDAGWVKAGNC